MLTSMINTGRLLPLVMRTSARNIREDCSSSQVRTLIATSFPRNSQQPPNVARSLLRLFVKSAFAGTFILSITYIALNKWHRGKSCIEEYNTNCEEISTRSILAEQEMLKSQFGRLRLVPHQEDSEESTLRVIADEIRTWRIQSGIAQINEGPRDSINARCKLALVGTSLYNPRYQEIARYASESLIQNLQNSRCEQEQLLYLQQIEERLAGCFHDISEKEYIRLAQAYYHVIDKLTKISFSNPLNILYKIEIIERLQFLTTCCKHPDYEFYIWCASQSAKLMKCSENFSDALVVFAIQHRSFKYYKELQDYVWATFTDPTKIKEKAKFILEDPEEVRKELRKYIAESQFIASNYFLPISSDTITFLQMQAIEFLSDDEKSKFITKLIDQLKKGKNKDWQFIYAILEFVSREQKKQDSVDARFIKLIDLISNNYSHEKIIYKLRVVLEEIKKRQNEESRIDEIIMKAETKIRLLTGLNRNILEGRIKDRLQEDRFRFDDVRSIFATGREDVDNLRRNLLGINQGFVINRNDICDLITSFFNAGKKIIVVCDSGGTGKTVLTWLYALRHFRDYSKIVSLSASSKLNLFNSLLEHLPNQDQTSIKKLSDEDEMDEEMLYNLVEALVKSIERESSVKVQDTLIIIDNLENEVIPIIEKLLYSYRGNAILTSRQQLTFHASMKIIPEGSRNLLFSTYEAVNYLTEHSNLKDPTKALELARKLQFHPLCVAHAAGYFNQKTIDDYQSYLDFLDQELPKSFLHEPLVGSYSLFFHTWIRNYEAFAGLHEPSTKLLNVLSYLDPDGMTEDLVKRLPLSFSFFFLTTPLEKNSLARAGVKNGEKTVSMHRMDQLAAKIYQKEKGDLEGLKSAISLLYNHESVSKFNPYMQQTIKGFQQVVSHCKALFESTAILDSLIDLDTTHKNELFYIFNAVGRYLFATIRQLNSALDWYNVDLIKKRFDVSEKHPFIAKAHHHRGVILGKLNRDPEALQAFINAENILQNLSSDDPAFCYIDSNKDKCSKQYQLAACREDMARVEIKLGDTESASQHLSEAGSAFSDLKIFFDFARVERERAKLNPSVDQSIDILQGALEILKDAYKEEFDRKNTTATVYYDLAVFQKKANRLKESAESCDHAYRINDTLDARDYKIKCLKEMIDILKECLNNNIQTDFQLPDYQNLLDELLIVLI